MTYKESFLRFMVDCGVLTFGEFTLKSGRKAPYFNLHYIWKKLRSCVSA